VRDLKGHFDVASIERARRETEGLFGLEQFLLAEELRHGRHGNERECDYDQERSHAHTRPDDMNDQSGARIAAPFGAAMPRAKESEGLGGAGSGAERQAGVTALSLPKGFADGAARVALQSAETTQAPAAQCMLQVPAAMPPLQSAARPSSCCMHEWSACIAADMAFAASGSPPATRHSNTTKRRRRSITLV